MKNSAGLFFLLFLAALLSHSSNLERFSTGTLSLGGVAQVPFKFDEYKNISLDIDIRPFFGYFVRNKFELSMKILLSSNLYFSSSLPNAKSDLFKWGAGFAATYYFDYIATHFVPYTGFGLGYEIVQLQWRTEVVAFEIPMGFLIPLTKSLAVDFGLPLKINVSGFYNDLLRSIEMPMGFIGLRGFF